jgi:glycerate 2-kinase
LVNFAYCFIAMDFRAKAEEIYRAGTDAVLPSALIPRQVRIRDNNLIVFGRVFNLDLVDDIFVIGAGKATAAMAAEIEKILGSLIREGHIVVKYDHICDLETVSLTEAGHPVPDTNGFRATKTIMRIANGAGTDDLVICLLSGGGSALLADYPEGSSPEDVSKLNSLLVNSGADISEINTVRKHLSMVKGGQLARAAYPATLISLIISDVAGDPLSVIASGPTVPDETTFKQALDILLKYDLVKYVPSSIIRYLEEGRDGLRPETPGPSDIAFRKTHNYIIGSNKIALEAARIRAAELGMNALIIDSALQGDAESVVGYIVGEALQFQAEEHHEPVCLLYGGETTVKMTGDGVGGRNQHLALLASVLLKDHPGITFLSAGTDGSDGPTDAAGAVVDSDTAEIAASKGLDPADFAGRFDSYNFFRATGGHIITGPTMTNVMDLIVVVIA